MVPQSLHFIDETPSFQFVGPLEFGIMLAEGQTATLLANSSFSSGD
jgi:hypothetical protein